MPEYSQANRPIRVETALGEDVLLLEAFSGEERVSAPYAFTLELVSQDAAIEPVKVLRSPAAVMIDLPNGEKRAIHGLISRFVQLGQTGGADLTAYRAELVPWLWFLSLSSDCKVFQNMTVLEIVEQVFKDLGYSDFEIKCVKSHPKREFCVQYRETHLNFVSRLLEEEGIFYFFNHTSSKHVLTLADDVSAVKPCPGQAAARMAVKSGGWQEEDVVTAVEREHAAYIGKVTLREFDYLQPSLRLESSVSGDGHGEIYDYTFPGNFKSPDTGDQLARLQLEEQEQWHEVVRGDGTCRSFQSGCRFDLKEHYRGEVNQAYQLLRVHHAARTGGYRSRTEDEFDYRNGFVAIPHTVPFRPPRITPKPVVQGSQTALVVGKAGEEIWVDKHGRVKVQFHWDRDGKKDENSSCWVRVSSTWAGKGWGFVQIPRIGQEVIVDFLEGDPDMPIITGRVYNAEQVPPYALPANQTQSGAKSRSSKGGGTDNFNELRFEDKKGSEEVYLQAEKDLTAKVKNDASAQIGNDRTVVIQNNDTLTVEKGDQAVDIKMGDQTITLGQGNQNIVIKMGDQNTQVDMGNMSTKVSMGNISTKADLGAVAVEGMQGIEFKVGGSSVKIDQMGVTMKGMMVKIEGQVQTDVKGLMTNINGDAMLKVKGGITMIN
jgi:type VI secretion system secreted protein VgrG